MNFLVGNGVDTGGLDKAFESKLQDKVVHLENPVGVGSAVEKAKKAQEKARSNRSKLRMSKNEHKGRGTFIIPTHMQKYIGII